MVIITTKRGIDKDRFVANSAFCGTMTIIKPIIVT
ncbi:hypothetical protein VPHK348_0048 [Vibrio phage K348]